MSGHLARALLDDLDDQALDELVVLLAPRLRELAPLAPSGWLDARAATEYLGLPSVDQLHKLTAARMLPFSQERPGAKCYFRRADLDAYRERSLHAAGHAA